MSIVHFAVRKNKQDYNAEMVEDFVSQDDLCIFYDNANSYVHPGNFSCIPIDLSILYIPHLFCFSLEV